LKNTGVSRYTSFLYSRTCNPGSSIEENSRKEFVSIVDHSTTAGFTKVEEEEDDDDDDDLPDSHIQSLNDEKFAEFDLLTMEETRPDDDDEDDDKREIHKERGLTLNILRDISEIADIIVDYVKKKYPFFDRAAKFEKKGHS
jgi:hypothetical protein